jgi:hypothetical protein
MAHPDTALQRNAFVEFVNDDPIVQLEQTRSVDSVEFLAINCPIEHVEAVVQTLALVTFVKLVVPHERHLRSVDEVPLAAM